LDQKQYLDEWEGFFSEGRPDLCGSSYLEDATMYVRLSPASVEFQKQVDLQNPSVLSGREAITAFWKTAITRLRIKKFDLVPYVLVVDDNTVVIGGEFTTDSVMAGQVLSQTWVRVADKWQKQSEMYVIQDMMPAAGAATRAPSDDVHEATVKSTSTTSTSAPVLEDAANSGTIGTSGNSSSSALELPSNMAEASEYRGGRLALWLVMTFGGAFVVFYLVRARRRKARMQIGGPDSLLG